MINKGTLFTSNLEFDDTELELRSKFQMMNIAIILSSAGLLFGLIINILKDIHVLVIVETMLLCINLILFMLLRFSKKSFKIVSIIETLQFTFLFVFLIYIGNPEDLRHVWIFTYPMVILYFQNERSAIYWVVFMVSMLLMAPLQPFVEISYSLFQVIYLSFVLIIISVIIYFYHRKIDEAKSLIIHQQEELKMNFDELKQKDKLLTIQSKQAVMGEMISMIAHQWRQPLSTVTLSISNIQVKKLLGENIEDKVLDKAFQEISDTVVYLSDTIDDFQTYFNPKKKISRVSIDFVINKAISFTNARVQNTDVKIELDNSSSELIDIYSNELIQVILNILNNAIDELISLNIKKPQININVKDEEDSFSISIKDNAYGISPEHIDRIFEPYFSTKDKNGTGLGLYMSQMIMQKQFNSKIEVVSSSEGSIFTINVPKKLS